ncbi:MAG TPA: hypothetical protein PKM16_08525 [Bacteroidia bacterium]|nr:hypothetical protein [Bacteroidia bacterium]HNS11694.1 hypothetical protein [Bacteroidia bacterium]
MKHGLLVFLMWSWALCLGCKNGSLKPDEYILYVRNPENGLNSCVQTHQAKFCIQLEPSHYLALKELKGKELSGLKLDKELEKFQDYLYVDFSIKLNDGSSRLLDKLDTINYNKNYTYLAFGLGSNIKLLNQHDTLNCLMYQFVDNYGISPEYHFQMIFDRPEELYGSSEYLFQFNDGVFNFEPLSVPISIKALQKLPTLKL